jgi:hypothetical protein
VLEGMHARGVIDQNDQEFACGCLNRKVDCMTITLWSRAHCHVVGSGLRLRGIGLV